MLVPREGGDEILLNDHHPLPSVDDPKLFLYSSDGRWICETETYSHWLETGDIVGTPEKQWKFVEAIPLSETEVIDEVCFNESKELTYRFNVSQNEEHVFLKVSLNGEEIDMEERVHHYVLLELARKRLADMNSGVNELEQGWVSRKDFAKMLGLDDTNHLNMQIFRFRKQLIKSLPDDELMPPIIESRRSEIRFSANHVEITGGLPVA